MSALLILLGASLGTAALFLFLFVRAVRAGQFDDPVTPAMRILMEEDQPHSRTPRDRSVQTKETQL